MYDKAQSVPQDYVTAYALLNLAVAGAAGPEREPWARIRDAVASKLSLAQRTEAQQMAFAGVPEVPCLPIATGVLQPIPSLSCAFQILYHDRFDLTCSLSLSL